MVKGLKLAAGAAALTAMAAPAFAQNVEANYKKVAAALESAGYEASIEGEGTDRFVSSASAGYTFSVFFFGCDDAGDACKTVQFYAGFAPDNKPTLTQMNQYAATRRWGRVYIDDEGDPVIEMDVDLEDGGMSKELFTDNVEYWETVMNAFADWVFDNAESGAES